MMKIAIVGATGPTGIQLVAELRKTVASVRAIARSADRLARLFPEAAVEKWTTHAHSTNKTGPRINITSTDRLPQEDRRCARRDGLQRER